MKNFLIRELFLLSLAETWPFLVSLLVQCVSSEISTSKRGLPRLIFAKTLRIIIQRAEDVKFSGWWALLILFCVFVASGFFIERDHVYTIFCP